MPSASAPTATRLACSAMGTRFEFVLVGDDAAHARAAGEAAIAEVEELHDRYSVFSRASLVTHINDHAAAGPVGIDRETLGLLEIARDVWRDTGGAFDITVGPLMRACGFRDASPPDALTPKPVVGMAHLELDARSRTVRFTQPGLEIDLGAIAKGFALDRATSILGEAGITRALLHGGTSTVVAIGSPPGLIGWTIRIADETAPLDVILRDAALSVSAPRGRTIKREDGLHGHIIDPRSGCPAAGAVTAAAMDDSAALADAWSTALLVLRARPDSTPGAMTTMIRDADDAMPWRIGGARATDVRPAPLTSRGHFETELDT